MTGLAIFLGTFACVAALGIIVGLGAVIAAGNSTAPRRPEGGDTREGTAT